MDREAVEHKLDDAFDFWSEKPNGLVILDKWAGILQWRGDTLYDGCGESAIPIRDLLHLNRILDRIQER